MTVEFAWRKPESAARTTLRVPRLAILAGLGVLFLAALVRFFRLGEGSLWYDEGYSTYLASESVPELIAHTARDIHPPLYYLVLHGWMQVAGQTDFAVAFPSVFFGLVLTALGATVARHWFGSAAGLFSGLLLALGPYQVWYSQEVRMYSLAAVLAVVATLSLTGTGRRSWFGYVVAASLSVYTLHYAFFLLMALNLFMFGRLLSRVKSGWSTRSWIGAQVAVLLVYLPWLPITIRQVLTPAVPPWREFTPLGDAVLQAWGGIVLGQAINPPAWLAVLVLAFGVLALGIRAEWSQRAVLALAASVAPMIMIWLVSLVTPLFHVRYLFPFSPSVVLLLGAGLASIWRASRSIGLVALAGLLLGFGAGLRGYFLDDQVAPDDYESATRFLSERWQPGDAILLNAGYIYAPVLHYWDRPVAWRGRLSRISEAPAGGPILVQTGTIDGSSQLGGGDPIADFYPTTWPETEEGLRRLAARQPRLWVVRGYDTVTDPAGQIRRWLQANGRPFEDQLFSGSSAIRVQGYLTSDARPSGPPVSTSGPVDVSGRPLIDQADVGGVLPVDLAWLAKQPVDRALRGYLVLVSETGRIWVQQDEPAIGTAWTPASWQPGRWTSDPRSLRIPPGTPAGRYRVELGAYFVGGGTLEFRQPDGSTAPRTLLGTIELRGRSALPDPVYDIRVGVDLADGVRIAGAQFKQYEAEAGTPVHIDLFWRSGSRPTDVVPVVRIIDTDGKTVAENRGIPADGRAPSSGWLPSELIRDPRDLVINPRARGPARLEAAVGDRSIRLADIQISSRDRRFDVPAGGRSVGARLGDVAELVSVDIVTAARSASAGLVWRALGETSTSYVVFLQLLDAQNRVAGQRDLPPGGGGAPTTSWVTNEVIIDRVEVPAEPGRYRLIVGMYDPRGGTRLRTAAGGDFVDLGEVEIR